MIPPQDADRLSEIIHRESRSLLRYLNDAYPWVRFGADEALNRLRGLARAEQEALSGLVRYFLREEHSLPPFSSYPASFTTMNFVSLDYLLPRMAADERRLLGLLESDCRALRDAGARAAVEKFLEAKRQHLKALESLVPRPEAAPAAAS
jgi:hypothetical protein